MGSDEASKRLIASLVKANIYASILAAATATLTGFFTGLISFPVYLHIMIFIPYLLGLQEFSEKRILAEMRGLLEN